MTIPVQAPGPARTTTAAGADVRVRFCPSPTGNPHVGLVRTALFNWAYARHTGGTFVLRIEDTDRARDTEESYQQLLETLRWLGLDWDEGPDAGGPHPPYRQSERRDVYTDVARRLLDSGLAYESFSSAQEIEARHRGAGRDPKLGYDNADRDLTDEQKTALRADGREPVLRLRMPGDDIGWEDLVRGEVTFRVGSVPDFVIVRAGGDPLYPLTNPVDDALMGITHVLRGEDLLSSTPRQIALHRALAEIGVGRGEIPVFGHLPLVMGEGSKKLSKRDPTSSLALYRERGFLPEGLLNYLALLGWGIGEDRDVFSLAEMVAAFDVRDVSGSPARFDLKKCEAINAAHVRRLDAADFAARVEGVLADAGLLARPATEEQRRIVRAGAPLVQERMVVLSEAVPMLGFLLVGEDGFTVDPDVAEKVLVADAVPALSQATAALADLPTWSHGEIEAALRAALVEGLGLKPKLAFGPVRAAVTGRRVSPPLFESMELLGRERSLHRLRAAVELARR
jgi:glutamyl-tRNA synthetase